MEEFLLETCVEQMLRDEDGEESIPPDLHVALNAEMLGKSSNPGVGQDAASIANRMADLTLASSSRFNPNASVFVPRGPAPPPTTQAEPAAVSSPPTDLKDQVTDVASSASKEESKAQSDVKELNTNETSHDRAAPGAPEGAPKGAPKEGVPTEVP